jgi:aspartyl-tRNA(Asn)/glutamyl-tRNA(Gln) amidotransferase subunit A
MAERASTITAAASALDAGLLTARDLVEDSLAAIVRHGPRTNAFTTVDEAGARRDGRVADDERARGVRRGPLHGIPISIKDLIDVEGVVTTAASRVLRDRRAERTATIVTRLRDAGAIVIGRTNLHEFALGTMSDSSAFGAVRHPFDNTRSAGGSSGGSAAAVATGMGLASIGTDTGGSVRIPAAACGVVGLKPALGEIPTDGVIPLSPSLDHVGPLARSVQDAAWLYAVMAGRTPWTVRTAGPSGTRLSKLTGYFDVLDDEVRTAFDAALDRLRRAGVAVSEAVVPDADRCGERYTQIVLPEAGHWHAAFLDAQPDDYTPTVRERLQRGRTILAVDHIEARAFRERLRRAVDSLVNSVDALVLPTLPLVAPPLGTETVRLGDGLDISARAAMLKHTQPFNMTGHPAITVPIPASGLPVGMQLVGRAGSTGRLLEIALACERQFSS